MTKNCPVCNKSAVVQRPPDGADVFEVSCPRCGSYRIDQSLASTNLDIYGERYWISGVIRNLYEKGEKLELGSNNLPIILESINTPKDDPLETIDLLLEHTYSKIHGKITRPFDIKLDDYPLLYLESSQELMEYMRITRSLGYIDYDTNKTIAPIMLMIKGWERLSENKRKKAKNKQAFVAMGFSSDLYSAWENGFKPALDKAGFKPIRIDLQEHNEKICDRILLEIKKSGLVVADFTGQRCGVYFEAGFAIGLGMSVIWTCKESDVKHLHFDTRQYNHIVWKNPEDLKTKLVNRIQATLPLLL